MLCALGIDIASVSRIGRLVDTHDQATLSLVFTKDELERGSRQPHPHRVYAACFATKEAVGKALGTGLAEIDWFDIEAIPTRVSLSIHLAGRAAAVAHRRGICGWLGSWCYWDDYVLVQVIAQGDWSPPTATQTP